MRKVKTIPGKLTQKMNRLTFDSGEESFKSDVFKLVLNGNLFEWINDFPSNRLQAVRVANSSASFRSVLSGVPRGSVLGPILFLVFINDIVDLFSSDLNLKLYADDNKMYTAIHNINSVAVLQSRLDALNDGQ